MTVDEIMSKPSSCLPGTNNEQGRLLGIVSLNDIVLNSAIGRKRHGGGPTPDQVLEALPSTCAHRRRPASRLAA